MVTDQQSAKRWRKSNERGALWESHNSIWITGVLHWFRVCALWNQSMVEGFYSIFHRKARVDVGCPPSYLLSFLLYFNLVNNLIALILKFQLLLTGQLQNFPCMWAGRCCGVLRANQLSRASCPVVRQTPTLPSWTGYNISFIFCSEDLPWAGGQNRDCVCQSSLQPWEQKLALILLPERFCGNSIHVILSINIIIQKVSN